MKEASNTVIALLITVFIIITLLQFSVYHVRNKEITLKATAVGFVGLCADNDPLIIPIPNQIAYIEELYAYDVNTTVANDANLSFYDDTGLFNITNTGFVSFTPNETDAGIHYVNISVVSSCGVLRDSDIMNLSVEDRNKPPVLGYIPDFSVNQSDILVYDVNATDLNDNDTLVFGDNTTMFQIDPATGIMIFIPSQQDVGNRSVLIWVSDQRGGVDWQAVAFEIIDVNDAPVLDTIGSQTAAINFTYSYDVNVTDPDVRPEWRNISFYDNATFFDINSTTGLIEFYADPSLNGTYWILINVTDGLLWDEEMISFTVVAVNHPPNITSWHPLNDTLYINEGGSVYFNITKFDPDGTIPSSQWYLDTLTLAGETNDEYTFSASYSSAGIHNITVIISDGELTDSHEWMVSVSDVPSSSFVAPPPEARPPPCMENWRCEEWSVCPSYGIQTRTCTDLNGCGTMKSKPRETRGCLYTPTPNCTDGKVNCHGGACEIWIDCGGACKPCPTCSDGIKNCHVLADGRRICEDQPDCGGPCPACLPPPEPVCGNAICEPGEMFACFSDCGLNFVQLLLAAIVLGGASVLGYRGFLVALAFYRKHKPPPFTDMEALGAYTLRRIHLVQLEMGKKPLKTIVAELSGVMKEFFVKAFDIRKKYTYIELAEVAKKRKLDKAVDAKIGDFAIKMTEIEYNVEGPSVADISAAIKMSIYVVEKLSGVKLFEALEKRSDEELKKREPKAEEVKLPPAPPGEGGKYARTEKDAESVRKLGSLIYRGEKALSEKNVDEASRAYSEIRGIYDELPSELKKELYAETVRIIKLYNAITSEMK